jgi:hypothetical protein
MTTESNTIEQKREKALADAKMYMANDWELKEETPEYFLLTRSKATFTKHLIIFFFTCWTFGFVNLLYHFMAKEKKKIVK